MGLLFRFVLLEIKRVLAIVTESLEELVGGLGTNEIRSIRSAIPDRLRLNHVY
jgi:hypothetical protein